MKKIAIITVLLLTTVISSVSAAEIKYRSQDYDKSFIPLDLVVYRPLGFLTTIVGTAVFIGLSPLTAFASIPEPHDAFEKTANIFIVAPGCYTFCRPLGDTSPIQFPDP